MAELAVQGAVQHQDVHPGLAEEPERARLRDLVDERVDRSDARSTRGGDAGGRSPTP
jgi:hypothetical protein